MYWEIREKLLKEIKIILTSKKESLNLLKSCFIFKNPNILIIDKIYTYNDLIKNINKQIEKIISNKQNSYLNLLSKVEVLNPITTIKRGYSIVKINNKTITSIKKVKKGDKITNQISDGNIISEVVEIYEEC